MAAGLTGPLARICSATAGEAARTAVYPGDEGCAAELLSEDLAQDAGDGSGRKQPAKLSSSRGRSTTGAYRSSAT